MAFDTSGDWSRINLPTGFCISNFSTRTYTMLLISTVEVALGFWVWWLQNTLICRLKKKKQTTDVSFDSMAVVL